MIDTVPVKAEDVFKYSRRAVKEKLAGAQGKGVTEGEKLTYIDLYEYIIYIIYIIYYKYISTTSLEEVR